MSDLPATSEPPPGTVRARGMPPLLRRLLLCACAAGGFAGMAAILHRALPPDVPEVTPKLDFLAAHRGDYDTVFIGSSRIYHGISPKVFDAVTAAEGKPTRSFNLGINGMAAPENLRLARTMMALRLPRLRTVFLEIASAQPMPDTNNLTMRDIYSQDWEALIYGLKRALLDFRNAPQGERLRRAWDDLSATAVTVSRNEFNIGRIDLTADLAKAHNRLGAVMLGPDKDGYLPLRRPLTDDAWAALGKTLETIRAGKVPERPVDALNVEGYSRVRDMMAARGVELVLVMAPLMLKDYHAWVDAPPGPRLLKFDDPALHPELFDRAHRRDSDHLNDDGARIFTTELARAYLAGK